MKLNKSGFTMVELLGVVVILAILMGIAIPNITNVMQKQKAKTYVEDAKREVSRAITTLNADNTLVKEPGTCFTLNFLDNGDFDESPNGGVYVGEMSYVRYEGKDSKGNDEYIVTMIECVDCKKGEKVTDYSKKELRGISKESYRGIIEIDDFRKLIKGGSSLYTRGIAGDVACRNAYTKKSEEPIVGGADYDAEYLFEHIDGCQVTNLNENVYPYKSGMTWKEYLDDEVYFDSTRRRSTVVITKEMIEKGYLRFYDSQNCYSESSYYYDGYSWFYPQPVNNSDTSGRVKLLTDDTLIAGNSEDKYSCNDDEGACQSTVVQLGDQIHPLADGVYRLGCYDHSACAPS